MNNPTAFKYFNECFSHKQNELPTFADLGTKYGPCKAGIVYHN